MKKYFTMVEIIITLIIILLLFTIGIPMYHNVVENAKAKACEVNLKVLLGALEAHAVENDQLPGSLSQLNKNDLQKAWAKVLDKEGWWRIKLVYFLIDFDKRGLAYAQSSWISRYVGALKYLTCPVDDTPPPAGFSYGLNSSLANISYNDYQNLASDVLVIADCDKPTFASENDLAKRHLRYEVFHKQNFAIAIKKGEEMVYSANLSSGKMKSSFSMKKTMPKGVSQHKSSSGGYGCKK
jgi:competence protein ComGC